MIKKHSRTIKQILDRIKSYEQTMNDNETHAFQHDQKQNKILTEFSSLKSINAEIEECVHFYLISLFLVRRSRHELFCTKR